MATTTTITQTLSTELQPDIDSTSNSRLFQPIRLSPSITLDHRIAFAPCTRARAGSDHVHHDIAVEYYSQRSSVKGTLIISEGTLIAEEAGGWPNAPGIYTPAQIAAWSRIADQVHYNGSFIFLQLWALGRSASPSQLAKEPNGPYDFTGASDIPLKKENSGDAENEIKPRPMTRNEIKRFVKHYRQAALNAIEAGFDGVELHSSSGYLIDQFISSVTNNRTDEYGGSIENRARFPLEVLKSVTDAIGPERTAIRLSPFNIYQDVKMPDPSPTFTHLVTSIRRDFPNLAYLHMIEPRSFPIEGDILPPPEESIKPFHAIWNDGRKPNEIGGVFIVAGGFDQTNSREAVDEIYSGQDHSGEEGVKLDGRTVVAIGRYFLSNPDLPFKIKHGIPLTPYDRSTFYGSGPGSKGYTDWPMAQVSSNFHHDSSVLCKALG